MRAKRIFVYALCIAAAAVVIALILHRSPSSDKASAPQPSRTVSVIAARRGEIARQLVIAGVFQPFQEIDVHGKVSGYVKHIYVDIGDRVRQGQTLAVLEGPELQAEVAGAGG